MTQQEEMQSLVDEFAYHLIKQDECISNLDSKTGNQHALQRNGCFMRLIEWGDEGRECLAQLLEYENPSVRCTAVAFLLRYKHDEAMAVLHDLAGQDELGIICFGAKCSIKNWHTGDWELDP